VDGRWLHDGQSFIFSGNEPGRGARLYLHRSDAAKPISPEGANDSDFYNDLSLRISTIFAT
jgi:hypothetical protein